MESVLNPYFACVVAIAALVFARLTSAKIAGMSEGDEKMRKIALSIRTGAMAFLNTEYKVLSVFVIVVFGLLYVNGLEQTAIAFLVGAFGTGAQLYDRQAASVRVSEQHSDFFVRNAVVVLVEERMALAVKRPESFVVGTFDYTA